MKNNLILGKVQMFFNQTILYILLSLSLVSTNIYADSTKNTEIEALKAEVADLKKKVEFLMQAQKKTETKITRVDKKTKNKPRTNFDIPTLEIKGFGHFQYDYAKNNVNNRNMGNSSETNSFVNGGVDLFITSQISDKLSFLKETIFEFSANG
jgi:signal transduction histidine kinase